jgi:hypothetical protein
MVTILGLIAIGGLGWLVLKADEDQKRHSGAAPGFPSG